MIDYRSTLNLPKTAFAMKARLSELEPKILSFWSDLDLYRLIRKKSQGRPKFILHDGPPYANGDIHIGHALNKILKDFVVRYKIMQGFDVPFIPGWDCHGLPVEHQLLKQLGIGKRQINKVEFRKKARDFALKFVDIQKRQFARLGLIADWEQSYLTLDPAYEAEIVRVFAKLAKAKYVYRGLKPINWCIDCETALAEAEIEYEDHRSPSIYVRFKLLQPEKLINILPGTKSKAAARQQRELSNHGSQCEPWLPVYFVIWTTTPWTLISNVAVALHPEFNYSAVKVAKSGKPEEILVIADDLVNQLMHQLGVKDYVKLGQIRGKKLQGLKLKHPFLERNSQLVLADYVSANEGSGCVHIAPGHGQEDYLTGLKYQLPVIMPVDTKGCFDASCGQFQGLQVFDANKHIIDRMLHNGSLLFAKEILHSYPHCWRCKSPLITRSTKQWFINMEHNCLRKKALKAAKRVQWIPSAGGARIASMIQTRPDWCLSRQRLWGVPIPVFYCQNCGKEILDYKIIGNIAKQISREGSDLWFAKDAHELLDKDFHCPDCESDRFLKEEDIIDVWFDSGVSHQAVLQADAELDFPATLYLEGSDQHRGWFQTSLLTSLPLTGKAPYQKVLTHGFVVDGEGKKMSKSKGNVVSPQEVTTKYGAEILRLWIASCDYTDDVRISLSILESISDAYRKVRNTLRFLLGNLYDFTPAKSVQQNKLAEIDQWALSSLAKLLLDVTEDFENFRYYRLYRKIYNFCVQQMSSFYLDILKDRLYTSKPDCPGRRSAQTAIYEILTVLTKMLAPILSFTAEEIWGHLSKINVEQQASSIMLSRWPKIERSWINLRLDEKMQRLARLRNLVLKGIEQQREKGLIRSSLEARVSIFVNSDQLYQLLMKNRDLLISMLIVSDVCINKVATFANDILVNPEIANLGIQVERIGFPKCQRCWNYRCSVGQNSKHPLLCQSCVETVEGREENA